MQGKTQSKFAASLASPPDASLSGNTSIELDSGEELRAHASHLEQVSSTFQGALKCLQPAAAAPQDASQDCLPSSEERAVITHRLPLPGVTRHQMLLLLHWLYSWTRESFSAALSVTNLVALATISDRYGALPVLHMVDSVLVKRSEAQAASPLDEALGPVILSAHTAPEQHKLARKLHLTGYEAHVGIFLGMHADEIDLTKVDPGLAHILVGASRIRAQMLASMLPTII